MNRQKSSFRLPPSSANLGRAHKASVLLTAFPAKNTQEPIPPPLQQQQENTAYSTASSNSLHYHGSNATDNRTSHDFSFSSRTAFGLDSLANLSEEDEAEQAGNFYSPVRRPACLYGGTLSAGLNPLPFDSNYHHCAPPSSSCRDVVCLEKFPGTLTTRKTVGARPTCVDDHADGRVKR